MNVHLRENGGYLIACALVFDLDIEPCKILPCLSQNAHDINCAARAQCHRDALHGANALTRSAFVGRSVEVDFVSGRISSDEVEGGVGSVKRNPIDHVFAVDII